MLMNKVTSPLPVFGGIEGADKNSMSIKCYINFLPVTVNRLAFNRYEKQNNSTGRFLRERTFSNAIGIPVPILRG